MTDAAEEFKALEKKLNHNLDRDLDYFSKDIKRMIANEIIKRYYFQRGGIIEQLKDDDDLQEAIKVLNDPAKYKEMLSAKVQKEEKKLNGEIARCNGMLNNEKFTSKAPQAKIDEEKAKLEKYTQMLAQVQERLKTLVK